MQAQNTKTSWLSGRRGRELRESLTAYLMISPAIFLILLFGIFPVFFAIYVSLHKWQLVRGEFRGLQNYISAIDDLMYVLLFGLAVLAFVYVYRAIRGLYLEFQEKDIRPYWISIPTALHAAAVLLFFRWGYLFLPGFLDIAKAMRGEDRTREVFLRLLNEAFRFEEVMPFWQDFLVILILSLIAGGAALYFFRNPDNAGYQLRMTLVWIAAAVGVGLLFVAFSEINKVYAAAVETGEDPGIWPQFIMITSGVILLLAGWRVWKSAEKQVTNSGYIFRILGGVALLVGAVFMIIEIPMIVASGDPDLWQGLKVTLFFSLGTVPIQLASALFLSILLFQKLKGSELFRIIFFIPWVTPGIASAAVFRQLFSNRVTSPANTILTALGLEPQLWLREPDGIISILGATLGLDIPEWAAGPSMALSVIILQSIWTYVGYNTVIYLAGLGNIPKELTEAAEVDGANKWNVFRHITFPLLSPTTYFLSLIAIIGTFKAFRTIWVLRDGAALGTTDPISVVIFIEFFTKTRYGYASALAFVLFAIILSLTFVNNKIQGSRVFYG